MLHNMRISMAASSVGVTKKESSKPSQHYQRREGRQMNKCAQEMDCSIALGDLQGKMNKSLQRNRRCNQGLVYFEHEN